jgi:hypothetical protein
MVRNDGNRNYTEKTTKLFYPGTVFTDINIVHFYQLL